MFDHNNGNNDNSKILEAILCELQKSQQTAEDNNALLRLISAEQIASKQLLQTIVNNTTPHPSTHSVVDKFSVPK